MPHTRARRVALVLPCAFPPVLLLYDTKAGHSGARPVSKMIADTTDELSFLFGQLGVAQ